MLKFKLYFFVLDKFRKNFINCTLFESTKYEILQDLLIT